MIAQALLETGILQFGYFASKAKPMPYRLQLEMLPAYPPLMQQLVYLAVQALPAGHYDRLVAHSDAIPIGTALALQTGVPLVYSRGRGEGAALDLVGAYDVGHPALLIVNSLQPEMASLIKLCRGVGLEIGAILELVSLGQAIEGIPHYAVSSMNALIHELRLNQSIAEQQLEAVLVSLES